MMVFAVVLADNGSDFGHMGWGDGGWWMMLFWGPVLLMVLIVSVLLLARSNAASWTGSGGRAEDPLDGARRILAERYARGELDSEEYQERVARLSCHRQDVPRTRWHD